MNYLKSCPAKDNGLTCSTQNAPDLYEHDPSDVQKAKSLFETNFNQLLLDVIKITPRNIPKSAFNFDKTSTSARELFRADLKQKFDLFDLKEAAIIEAVAILQMDIFGNLTVANLCNNQNQNTLSHQDFKGFFNQQIYFHTELRHIHSQVEKLWKKLLKNFHNNKGLIQTFSRQILGKKHTNNQRNLLIEEQNKLDQEEIKIVHTDLILKDQKLNFSQLPMAERLKAGEKIFQSTTGHLIDFIFEKLGLTQNGSTKLLYSNLVEHQSELNNLPKASTAIKNTILTKLSELYLKTLANQTLFTAEPELTLKQINNFQQEFLIAHLNLFEENFKIAPNILRRTIQYFMDQCFMTTLDFFFAMHVGKVTNPCQNQNLENCQTDQSEQPKATKRFTPSESLILLLQFFWEDLCLANPEITSLNHQDLANHPAFLLKLFELKESEPELTETPIELIVKYLQQISSDKKNISAPPQSLQQHILFEGFPELYQKWLKIKNSLGKRYNFTEQLIDEICDLFLKPELNQIISQPQGELLLNLLNQILDRCNLTDPTKLQLNDQDKIYLAQLCKNISHSANLFSQPSPSIVNLLTELSRMEALINSHHVEEAIAKTEFQQLQHTQDQIDQAKEEAQLIDQQLLSQRIKIEKLESFIQKTIQDNFSKPFSILQTIIEQLEEIQQLLAIKDKIQQDLQSNQKKLAELEITLQQQLEKINPQNISALREEQTQLKNRIETLTSSINQITAQIKTLLPLAN